MTSPTWYETQRISRGSLSMKVKRAFDVLMASIALTVFVIPMLILMLAIYLNDRGPVFYRQIRVGRDCLPFGMLKFRSMIINADKIGGYATTNGDPRITSIGRFIRRTSLDELPQLFNVLRGDMSIVGPRPDVPAQETLYTQEQWQVRHRVRPGITGLAQAVARSAASAEERIALDLAYVRTVSVPFDLKIILMTVRQLIARTGN